MEFYFQIVVVLIGVVGAAANGLILYALVASKQHRKHVLIANQNLLDLVTCLCLVIVYSLKLCNIYLTGSVGYWLCIMVLSEFPVMTTSVGSVVNLAVITTERYLKVVHPVWSQTKHGKWMTYRYSATAFAWIFAIAYNLAVVLPTSTVMDGACYGYVIWKSETAKVIHFLIYFLSNYVAILILFIFCYGRIVLIIRQQARVMADHGGHGPSTASHHIQTNVIKTMIIVSAFYAVAWLPFNVIGLLFVLNPLPTLPDSSYYASLLISFLYVCTNPFIYATKFDPVKQVLLRMIPCKKTPEQATGDPN